jgi:pyruvate/2-oxoglutarate dehydrogenase complex dihydrolipoamide dehydrogenase (E3) component
VAVIQDQLQRNSVMAVRNRKLLSTRITSAVENGNGRSELEGANVLIAIGTKPAVNPQGSTEWPEYY